MPSSPKPPTPPTRQYQLIPIRNQSYALPQNRLHDNSSPINRYNVRQSAPERSPFCSFGKCDQRQQRISDMTQQSQYIDSTTSDDNLVKIEDIPEMNGVPIRRTAYYYNELRINSYLKSKASSSPPTSSAPTNGVTTESQTTVTSSIAPVLTTDFDEVTQDTLETQADNNSETEDVEKTTCKEFDDEVARNTRFNANLTFTSSSFDSVV